MPTNISVCEGELVFYNSLQHGQRAVGLQRLCKGHGSVVANVITGQAVQNNQIKTKSKTNKRRQKRQCTLGTTSGGNCPQHIQNSLPPTGHLLQRGQRVVCLQGLCKSLGSVSADVVAAQAVRRTTNQTKSKSELEMMHTRHNQRSKRSQTHPSVISVLLVCRACASALAPSAPMLFTLRLYENNKTKSKISVRWQKQEMMHTRHNHRS